MNRRSFLKGVTALVGGLALEEAIPLGRVWSFPKEIKRARCSCLQDFPFMGEDLIFTVDDFATRYLKPALDLYLSEWEKEFRAA